MDWNDGDKVVVAWAEHVNGPGWTNQLVWVLIRAQTGELRVEAIQPQARTSNMEVLFDVCAEAHRCLTSEVRHFLSSEN